MRCTPIPENQTTHFCDFACQTGGESFHPSAAGAFIKGKTHKMNTETAASELASQALAQLSEALQSGKSEALTAYLKVMARFTKYSWGNCLLISMQEGVT
jgi:hypothetical protein